MYGTMSIEDMLQTCPSSISGNCQVFSFTSYPCTCTSEHVKQGQMIQFWSFSTSHLIIAEHSKSGATFGNREVARCWRHGIRKRRDVAE